MTYRVRFVKSAEEQYDFWKTADARIFKRLKDLIAEIKETPFSGSGHPEPLRFELQGKWSRRITQKDRIVYALEDGEIVVYQCRFHY